MYDIRIREKPLFGVNIYYNQFGIYQPSRVPLLKPWQNNLTDPEAHQQPCQTSKMDCFAKLING